jgi:hypothetical protein
MGIRIRSAKPTDIDWLVDELRKFDKFYGTKKKLFGDETYVRDTLLAIMDHHVFLVAEKEEVRVGFIAGINQPHSYNPDLRVLVQFFWWVLPEHRRSLAATLLMDEFILYGKNNCDWISLSMASVTPINPKSLIRKGFVESDRTFLMEVN